jgi:dolichyl-phosphate-mannose-protein mannosyltransferase
LEVRRRTAEALSRALITSIYLVAVVACFWYFHPIYTAALISYNDWLKRMWFPSWI